MGVGAVSTGRQHVRAQMFETGSNDGGYRLEALDIYLLDVGTADGARITIHENTNRVAGGNRQDFPGASLHSLTTPITGSSVANTAEKFTFPARSNAMLEPDTKYWIVVEATGGASAVLQHQRHGVGRRGRAAPAGMAHRERLPVETARERHLAHAFGAGEQNAHRRPRYLASVERCNSEEP